MQLDGCDDSALIETSPENNTAKLHSSSSSSGSIAGTRE